MVDRDVLLAKIAQIKNCLRRIRKKTGGKPETLEELDIQDVFVLNLQRAVQSSLDLAAHIVADESLGMPEELRDNFTLLEKAGIIDRSLSDRLVRMVGFRNIAVHDYSALDVNILKSILQRHLKDIESFSGTVIRRFLKDRSPNKSCKKRETKPTVE